MVERELERGPDEDGGEEEAESEERVQSWDLGQAGRKLDSVELLQGEEEAVGRDQRWQMVDRQSLGTAKCEVSTGTHVDLLPAVRHVPRKLGQLHHEHHLRASDLDDVWADGVDGPVDVTGSTAE